MTWRAAAYGLGGLTNLQLWNIPILGILNSTWNGCVADRDKNYDTTNTVPSSSLLASLFPIEQYDNCPVELMPLSHDWNKLNAKVDSMKPVGMTNQTIGLQWGFQSLTAAPFTIPAKNSNYKYSEVIIMLTDGLNTENRFGDNTATMDARTLLTCSNIKSAGITLYTVRASRNSRSPSTPSPVGAPQKLQVALALDTTGSMASDGKMPALKTVTEELLTTLQTAAVTNGDVRVAIVPFAKYVKRRSQQPQSDLARLGRLER